MSIYMAYLVVSTSLKSNLFEVRIDEPWFTTTLIDFYLNIIILSAWVIYKEASTVSRFLWIAAFVCTGAIATHLYVLVQLLKLRPGDSLNKVLLPVHQEKAQVG